MSTFQTKVKVRMDDTDLAGVIFFANQYRFVHATVEEWYETLKLPFHKIFSNNPFVFVIVHSEANYLKPLQVGDLLCVTLQVETIGKTSLTLFFSLKRGETVVGTAKIVQVCLNKKTKQKQTIPKGFIKKIEKYKIKN